MNKAMKIGIVVALVAVVGVILAMNLLRSNSRSTFAPSTSKSVEYAKFRQYFRLKGSGIFSAIRANSSSVNWSPRYISVRCSSFVLLIENYIPA